MIGVLCICICRCEHVHVCTMTTMVRLTPHKQQTTSTPHPSNTERVEGSKTFNLPGDRKLSLTPAYDHNTKAFELEVAQVRSI